MPDKYSDPSDRRAEPRRPASGNVKIRPDGLPAISIPGEMVDINSSGFRARHSLQTLVSGHIVEYAYGDLEGRARVGCRSGISAIPACADGRSLVEPGSLCRCACIGAGPDQGSRHSPARSDPPVSGDIFVEPPSS